MQLLPHHKTRKHYYCVMGYTVGRVYFTTQKECLAFEKAHIGGSGQFETWHEGDKVNRLCSSKEWNTWHKKVASALLYL